MKLDDAIIQFTTDIEFEALLKWCDILKVPHFETMWLDDEWVDKEDELRDNLASAMVKAGSK